MDSSPAEGAAPRRVVLPRSARYNLSATEQGVYRQFVEMMSQIDRGARLRLAESAVHAASQHVAAEILHARKGPPTR